MPGIGKYIFLGTAGAFLLSQVSAGSPGRYIKIGDDTGVKNPTEMMADNLNEVVDAASTDFHDAAAMQAHNDTIIIGDYKVLRSHIGKLQYLQGVDDRDIIVLSWKEEGKEFNFYRSPDSKLCEKYEEFIGILGDIESKYQKKHRKDEGFEDNINFIITDEELQEYYINTLKKKMF